MISTLLVTVTGCGRTLTDSEYGCTAAGKTDSAKLASELKHVGWHYNACDSLAGTGVTIEPFPGVSSLEEGEAHFRGLFDCGKSTRRAKNSLGEPNVSFRCRIAGIEASVGLTQSGSRVDGNVFPLAR